jgi:hypothetical protein
MSNLTPTTIVDKNGKTTTVHKNNDKGSGGVSDRASSVANSAPTPAAVKRPDIDSYEFTDNSTSRFNGDFFDVRDIGEDFAGIAQELRGYVDESQDAYGFEEPEEVQFDDDSDVDALVDHLDKFAGYLREMGLEEIEKPDENTPHAMAGYAQELSEAWDNIQNNNGVTIIKDDYKEEYAEEFVTDTGSMPDGVPDWLKENINWAGVADDLIGNNPTFEVDGDTFYLT